MIMFDDKLTRARQPSNSAIRSTKNCAFCSASSRNRNAVGGETRKKTAPATSSKTAPLHQTIKSEPHVLFRLRN